MLSTSYSLDQWGRGKLFINRNSPPYTSSDVTRRETYDQSARRTWTTSLEPESMRRLRYSVAATLDGFIADPDGGYDWIIMDEAIDFAAMFTEFDTFVMGRKTWDVSARRREFGDMFGGKEVIVFSRTLKTPPRPGVTIVNTIPRRHGPGAEAEAGQGHLAVRRRVDVPHARRCRAGRYRRSRPSCRCCCLRECRSSRQAAASPE